MVLVITSSHEVKHIITCFYASVPKFMLFSVVMAQITITIHLSCQLTVATEILFSKVQSYNLTSTISYYLY